MRIWIDADACPTAIKEIVSKAAHKRRIETIFVANAPLSIGESQYISIVQVKSGPDEADAYIADNAGPADLVITQDIPLAHILVGKSVAVLDQRGGEFTEENIGERLSIRDFMQGMRDTGEVTGGPKAFGDKEKRAFASTFDRVLARLLRASGLS